MPDQRWKEFQEAIGPLWEIVERLPPRHEIRLADESTVDPEVLFEESSKVHNLAASKMAAADEMMPAVEGYWLAAEVLLGPSKYAGLEAMYDGVEDRLDVETVVLALLGEVTSEGEGYRVQAGPPLLERITRFVDQAGRVAATPDEIVAKSEEEWAWELDCKVGWLDFLATEFTIHKTTWEDNAHFAFRVGKILGVVSSWYPA